MPHTLRLVLIALVVAVGLAGGLAGARADEALPTDPAVTAGTLDNGLAYLVKSNRNPEGRAAIWLHVASGSLNETETTRGLAHYLEHMAFNGSANFPPGSVVPFFQSLGLTFGRDQNAFTSFDQTVYTLNLPDARPETLDKGMRFLADAAFRLSLPAPGIEGERQIVLEEKRARASARQRVREYIYERLAPESTLGRRLPIGTEATIRSVTRADFEEYYRRWYVPSNMTVLVVGDLAPADAVAEIRRHFGAAPAEPRPVPAPVGVQATPAPRAIVATDAELTRAEVSITRVEPPRPPTRTVAALRSDLVEEMATWILNRRLAREVAEGKVAFLDASASVQQWAGAIRTAALEASGKPEAWRAMLSGLGTALQRARLHGFSEREAAEARTALLARAEEGARAEATLPARTVLRHLNAAVAAREPVVSAAQYLELLRRLLPGITANEVSQAFAAGFDPARALFIAELPAGTDVPAEGELLALGQAAVEVKPERLAEAERPTTLLATPPPGGAILTTREHPASGVVSTRLANGVKIHHRFMDQRKNEVRVVITLAGGTIQEDPASRGLTEAAALAWERPATSTLSSPAIRELMTGKKVRVRGEAGEDTLNLVVSGDPADLETGLQLAYLLLTDPVVEAAALEQWKEKEIQRIAARKQEAWGVLGDALAAAFYPPREARLKPLTADEIRAVTREGAQAWLRRLLVAPMEVGVVGDVDRAAAFALAARYLGSLPPRPLIDHTTLADLRTVARTRGPIADARTVEAAAPQAAVLAGFFAADATNLPDVRRLNVAARVLSNRMLKSIREEKQLVYSIGAASRPARVYPGFGTFYAQAPTDPAKTAALTAAVEEMFTAFAAEGPTAEEMEVARRQVLNALDEAMRTPDFWIARLAQLDYRATDLADLLDARRQYTVMTAAEVREAFARYNTPAARFRFVVTPRPRS